MHDRKSSWLLCTLLAAGLAMSFSTSASAADDAKPEKPAAKKARAEARGYLPAYYRDVVDGVQRDQVYEIQKKYDGEMRELSQKLKEVTAKRDAEIEALLRPEQKEKLKQLQAEATERRTKAAEAAATTTKKSDESK